MIGDTTKDPRVRFPSSWRDPIGKLLSSRRITALRLSGWYGQEAKLQAQARQVKGVVHVCIICKTDGVVHYRSFSYLARGFYCDKCLAAIRHERKLDEEFRQRIRDEEAKLVRTVFV